MKQPSVHVVLILAQVCFASMAVVGKLALGGQQPLPPNAIVVVRVVGGGAIFWLLARLWKPGEAVTAGFRRGDVPRLVACALLGIVINQFLFVNGLARTSAVNSSVIGATIPIYTVIGAFLAGAERPRPARLVGIALALAGIMVLVRVEGFSFRDDHAVGNLMILVNALSYGAFLVVVKPLSGRGNPMALIAVLFGVAALFVVPLGLPALVTVDVTPRVVGFLAYFIAVPTVGAYALTQLALARAESSLVAVYIYLQPVIAAIGAVLFLGERPGARTLVAALLIAAGLAIASRRWGRSARPPTG